MKRRDCDCIDKALPLLTLKNTKMVVALSFTGECDKAVIATELIHKRRDGKRSVLLVATYCPFCGKKYPVKDRGSVVEGVVPK